MAKRKPERDHRFFEEWARRMNMKPVMKVIDPEADILLADSGEPFFGANQDGELGQWYRTGYAIDRDGAQLGNFNEYPAEEYADISAAAGQQARIKECLAYAREALKLTINAGLYKDG